MEFNSQDETGEQYSMDIVPVEGELRLHHVIPVDVDNRHHDALWRELCILVKSA